MKGIILIISVLGLLILSGCSAGIVGKISQVNDDYATIFMARKGGGMGGVWVCYSNPIE